MAEGRMKIIFAERARKNLHALLRAVGPMKGLKIRNSLAVSIDLLSDNPQMGALEQLLIHTRRAYRGHTIDKLCKLIYFIDETSSTVVIADVWDTRREPHNLMHGLS